MECDFENSDFPGMYSTDNKKNNDSDFSDENHEKLSKKDLLIGKRKDKKDKGYATLEGESSPEDDVDTKSPSKSKKSKPFKFSSKKEKREKSREKENREQEKEKKKDKTKHKTKSKDKKKLKNGEPELDISEKLPIFGVPLAIAVQRNPCHDGVKIPLMIRNCIDYVQEHGLTAEGIYKISGVKSRVQNVYALYNKRKTVYESDFDLTIATSLVKQFLRLLPESIFTNNLLNIFEDASLKQGAVRMKRLLEQTPECNQHMLKWLFVHLRNVCVNEKANKMNASLLGTVFCPLLQISPKLFINLIDWVDELFPNAVLTRYIPPMRCVSPNMPSTYESVATELQKQESLLSQIHFEMNAGFSSKDKEDELWGVQRNITQLKRKLKTLNRELQQILTKMADTTTTGAANHETDRDDEIDVVTNASDSSSNVITEKLNDNVQGADTTPSVDESLDKPMNYYKSSQENLNNISSSDSDDEEKLLEFESEELITLVQILQEEIKTERLKINQLKAELHASKMLTSVTEYTSGLPDGAYKDENNLEGIREYNLLQLQKDNLLKSIMKERDTIIDLKIQISMIQKKHALSH